MKPIRMVVSAFGPYKDRVEIDFEKLGDNGIFLITGDTGSGKTTIFDALSFALFGEASGSRRENSSFRSDFASDDVNTFVELEFIHKNVVYKIERVPRYTRKKKRGDGVTSVGGDATLTYLDMVITGEKNVTDKCIEILGMNANQFKQIVMIAQGEFLELLLAKTKDRATIFRRIFDTGIYKDISDSLKNKYLLKKREYEDTATLIKGYIQGVQLSNELNGDESTDQVIELLDKELKGDIEVEKSLEEERNVLFKESSRIVEVISKGKIINDSIIELGKAKEQLNILLSRKDEVADKEVLINKNKDIWELIVPKYMDLSKLKKEFNDKKNKLDNNKKKYNEIIIEYDDNLVKYNSINNKLLMVQEYNKLIEVMKNKLLLLGDIKKLEIEFEEVNNKILYFKLIEKSGILNKFKICNEQENIISDFRNKISILKEEYVKDNEVYGKHYDMFLSAQAGILASNLKDGCPCPVCGSTKHPNLAVMVEDVLSKEELEKEKVRLEEKYLDLENLRLDLIDKENKVEILKQELKEFKENVLIREIDVLQAKCLTIKVDEKDLDINDLENKSQRLSLLISEKRCDLDNDDTEDSLNVKINELNKNIVTLEDEIKEIRNNYEYLLSKKADIESFVKVLDEDIRRLEKSIEEAELEYVKSYQELGYSDEEDYISVKIEKQEIFELENEIKKYNNELVKLKSNIESLDKVIAGKEEINLNTYEEELKVVNEKLGNINMSLKNINSKIVNNKKVYDNLKIVSEKTTKLEHEVIICKDLSDTANGSITGKSKLEFEQYVQASYFDRVLISANKRLSYMTDERYQLMRKEEATKVSDKLGLELEVMDYYTGKRRDIKSLSGGESFKASLSLALGMSDTIQEYSGGVVVEAMFIDEGFGSLDDESLEQAMNAIMMLSQGNKMIGIISHVNELKARIDKKIVVKKSSSGSSVSLVV